ncbi:hypothetical protein HanPSC8_Chr11g0468551 [Helianthus annuus]|nr:hypothetical protein HanPSC8_Chr11g0468551 [Helianthus annuus]
MNGPIGFFGMIWNPNFVNQGRQLGFVGTLILPIASREKMQLYCLLFGEKDEYTLT